MNETNEQDLPEMGAEQAADFAALEAASLDGAAVPGQAPEPEQQGPKLADEIAGMLTLLVGVAKPLFPSLEKIYTPEVIAAVGTAAQPLCEKHGWLQNGIGGKYGEEIMFLVVTAPLAYATYGGVQNDLAARAAAKAPEQRGGVIAHAGIDMPAASQGSKSVTFGAPL